MSEASEVTQQTIDEVVRDLVGDYPGTVVSVEKNANMALLRLSRRGTFWTVCVGRAEPIDEASA